MAHLPQRRGLQVERTELAWERTAIGYLAAGAVPLLRAGGPLEFARTALAVIAVLLALLVVWLSQTRARQIRMGLAVGARVVPASAAAFLIGWGTCGFAAMIVVLLILRM